MITKLFIVCISCLVLSSLSLQAQIKTIDIKASALFQDKITNNYSVVLFMDGQKVDSMFSKKATPIFISLEINKLYTIVFKKEKLTEKLVIVNTQIPTGLSELDGDVFKLEIEMGKIETLAKQELKDYPVAILNVSRKAKSLMASESYYKLTHN